MHADAGNFYMLAMKYILFGLPIHFPKITNKFCSKLDKDTPNEKNTVVFRLHARCERAKPRLTGISLVSFGIHALCINFLNYELISIFFPVSLLMMNV